MEELSASGVGCRCDPAHNSMACRLIRLKRIRPGPHAALAGAAAPAWRAARIRSDAFSAIMIVAALVLPGITVGTTGAATTRRPSPPVHRHADSTTHIARAA